MSEFNNQNVDSQSELDRDDFVAFNSSSGNDFIPGNSSSPPKVWEPKNNYKRNWNNRKFSGNTSFLSPHNNSRNRSYNYNNKRHSKSSNQSFNQSFNSFKDTSQVQIRSYLHPSFLEDPWKRLEEFQASKIEAENMSLPADLSSPKNVDI